MYRWPRGRAVRAIACTWGDSTTYTNTQDQPQQSTRTKAHIQPRHWSRMDGSRIERRSLDRRQLFAGMYRVGWQMPVERSRLVSETTSSGVVEGAREDRTGTSTSLGRKRSMGRCGKDIVKGGTARGRHRGRVQSVQSGPLLPRLRRLPVRNGLLR